MVDEAEAFAVNSPEPPPEAALELGICPGGGGIAMTTREITYRDALAEALAEEMERDSRVFILGEDIYGGPGGYGGCFKVTKSLGESYCDCLLDTPMAEQAIVGVAVGAAMTGLRPVAEIMYEDFITLGMDLMVNTAAKTHYITGGQYHVPMVLRAPCGAMGVGPQHSQTWTSWFMHVPGLHVVFPSTPHDAKGLLKTAIRDPNPVVFPRAQKALQSQGPGARRGVPDPVRHSPDRASGRRRDRGGHRLYGAPGPSRWPVS